MKHIKEFEKIQEDPIIGDFVICVEDQPGKINDFISSNAGCLYDITNEIGDAYKYIISYTNIPIHLINECGTIPENNGKIIRIRRMSRREIKDFSRNKKELEQRVLNSKFNL